MLLVQALTEATKNCCLWLVIMAKLPNDICSYVPKENQSEAWELKELMEPIHVKVEVQEASEPTKVNVGRTTQPSGSTSGSHSIAI